MALLIPASGSALDLPKLPLPEPVASPVEAVRQQVKGVTDQVLPNLPLPPDVTPPPAEVTPVEEAPAGSFQEPAADGPANPATAAPSSPAPIGSPSSGPGTGGQAAPSGSSQPQSGGGDARERRAAGRNSLDSKPPAADSGGEPKPSDPTILERLIDVVPLEFKLAIVILGTLLAMAVATAGRTRWQLADARRRAATDGLTGLPNRRHIDEVVERLLSQAHRKQLPLSAIIFDLDHFKAINDKFGHDVGDETLRATGVAIRELLRGADHVARFGGEEFVVLLPETTGADAILVAEKMRKALADVQVKGMDGGFFTASFGVAAYPDEGLTSQELFKSADEALYRAKEGGRNRVERATAPLRPELADALVA